jgi:RNA polymerase primary sigma factor
MDARKKLLESKPRARLLDEATKSRIYQQSRRGVAHELLAGELAVAKGQVTRIVNEMRARRLLETELSYMPHPSFEDRAQHATILGPMPEAERTIMPRRLEVPEGTPPYLASLYEAPLLSREQEAHLFRKMNFLKYQASQLRDKLEPARAKAAELDAIERLQEQALAVKNQIIRANLRLVVSIAKKHIAPSDDFFELVSDGNMSLIRAVEKFDFARGNKFSTYASWAIMNNFARTIPKEKHRRDRFLTGHEEMFDAAADHRSDEHEFESAQARSRAVVSTMLDRLGERERHILINRYGLGGAAEQTLEQLGRELGVTKERVRQIEFRAQAKLRRIADEEHLDLAV